MDLNIWNILIFLDFLCTVMSFRPSATRMTSVRKDNSIIPKGSPTVIRASASSQPFETEDTEEYYSSADELPKFDSTLLHQLDKLVDNLLSGSTMSTVSYYMLEFKNDIEYQYITKFENCDRDGFTKQSFDEYINKMIRLDGQELHVIIDPPKNYMKSIDPSRRSQARLQYSHMVEPRKLANQIISVREDVCNEMIVDLNSIRLEHKEAIKFAKAKLKDGPEAADKQRRITRVSPTGSTPYRDKSFHECSLLLTNIALDLMRVDFERASNPLGAKFITEVVESATEQEKIYLEEQGLTNIPGARSPNFILGDIYFKGLKDGLVEGEGHSLNTMKLAKSFLATRLSLAMEMSDLLADQIRTCRQYYTMIKELGGFARLDFSVPKMKVVYLDDLAAEDQAVEAKAKALAQTTASAVKATDKQEETVEKVVDKVKVAASSTTEKLDSFGSDIREVTEVPTLAKKDKKGVLWESFEDIGPISM
jgi:hypothetical protein